MNIFLNSALLTTNEVTKVRNLFDFKTANILMTTVSKKDYPNFVKAVNKKLDRNVRRRKLGISDNDYLLVR